jgi:hypothetical protein
MNKWLINVTVAVFMMVCSGGAFAGGHGWVTSIMHSVHSDQVYRVQIYKVDGKQFDAREYKLAVGEHTIGVTGNPVGAQA